MANSSDFTDGVDEHMESIDEHDEEENILEIEVENGALLDAPIWNNHRRAKNWFAVIELDPASPSGLNRKFQEKAHGSYYYMIDGLKIGDAVEFGADYYTGSGRKCAKRWYGVIIDITPFSIKILETGSGREACLRSVEYRPKNTGLSPEAQELLERLKALPADMLKTILETFDK